MPPAAPNITRFGSPLQTTLIFESRRRNSVCLQLILKTAMLGPKNWDEGFGKAFISYYRLGSIGAGPRAFGDTQQCR